MSITFDESVPTTNRQWALDVNESATETPEWTPVRNITAFTPNQTDTMADDSDFDSGLWTSQGVQSRSWAPTATVRRNIDGTKAFDPGQEALRAAADAATPAHIRYYNRATPQGEAYEGIAQVGWSPTGGAGPGWQEVNVTLTGRGERLTITHPDTAAVAWAATTAYTVGQSVTITGGTLTATVAGTSDTTEPALPATVGATVVDGTVTWERTA